MWKLPAAVVLFVFLLPPAATAEGTKAAPVPSPPLPHPPLPSASQLQWQLDEMAMFLHFGMNTFTDSEWGNGTVSPSTFSPSLLDARQWVSTAAAAGFRRVVITAKHHDGFCLWPSMYTNYSVRSSSWRGGKGDVVGELAAAANEAGLKFAVYLSPWDRHEGCYGKTKEYNEYYLGQMRELLTRYGETHEVFLDGAKGEGAKNMSYMFNAWFQVIHQLQPQAVIFSDVGPDVRWVGDEAGVAGTTCWSTFNTSNLTIGGDYGRYSQQGDPYGPRWVPAECDVSIREGWFWHASQRPKSPEKLLDLYYKSVGRNCQLLLNVPPNSSGLISEEDIQALQKFSKLRYSIFSNNLAKNASVTANSVRGTVENSPFHPSNVLNESIYSYWAPDEGQSKWELFLDLHRTTRFNVLQLQEPIQMGQRVSEFFVDVVHNGHWRTIINGTTIGYKRLLKFPPVKAQCLRLWITCSHSDPLISFVGIYMDSFSLAYDTNGTSIDGSEVINLMNHNSSGNAGRANM